MQEVSVTAHRRENLWADTVNELVSGPEHTEHPASPSPHPPPDRESRVTERQMGENGAVRESGVMRGTTVRGKRWSCLEQRVLTGLLSIYTEVLCLYFTSSSPHRTSIFSSSFPPASLSLCLAALLSRPGYTEQSDHRQQPRHKGVCRRRTGGGVSWSPGLSKNQEALEKSSTELLCL